MKITKTQLKQIIKEELETVIAQEGMTDPIPPQVLNSPDPSVRALGTEIHYTSAGGFAARAGDRRSVGKSDRHGRLADVGPGALRSEAVLR